MSIPELITPDDRVSLSTATVRLNILFWSGCQDAPHPTLPEGLSPVWDPMCSLVPLVGGQTILGNSFQIRCRVSSRSCFRLMVAQVAKSLVIWLKINKITWGYGCCFVYNFIRLLFGEKVRSPSDNKRLSNFCSQQVLQSIMQGCTPIRQFSRMQS